MSRASKLFLASSVGLCGATIWGVHFLQQRESDTMYQGVLKDEARMKAHPLTIASLLPSSPSSTSPISPEASTSSAPLNTPSSPSRAPGAVQQPPAVLDPECDTCRISPPAALVEAQSPDERRREREAREEEYKAQRALEGRLRAAQGVGGDGSGGGRLV